jgi:hypothetical protein
MDYRLYEPYQIGDGFSRTIIHVSDIKASD